MKNLTTHLKTAKQQFIARMYARLEELNSKPKLTESELHELRNVISSLKVMTKTAQ